MTTQAVAQIPIIPKLVPVFDFSKPYRYRGAYGGRGGGKTRGFALAAALRALQLSMMGISGVILCGREFMNSLEDSSMAEVKAAIESLPWLKDQYDIGEKYIRTANRKIEFVFAGLRHNLDSIKSKSRILIWITTSPLASCYSNHLSCNGKIFTFSRVSCCFFIFDIRSEKK